MSGRSNRLCSCTTKMPHRCALCYARSVRTLKHAGIVHNTVSLQLGIVSVRAGDNGIGSVWASRGLLLGDVEVQAETDIDAEGDLPDMPPTHDEALVHIMDFSWVQVQVGVEADKDGRHLAAAASGPLARDAASSFHMQRVPVGTKHGVDGAATHHSDVGDILALALASGSTHVQWLAVREKDPSTTTFWQTYQWWIMGAIFVANLGLRSWARGRGRSDAAPAPPSMEEARAARRGKSKSKSS